MSGSSAAGLKNALQILGDRWYKSKQNKIMQRLQEPFREDFQPDSVQHEALMMFFLDRSFPTEDFRPNIMTNAHIAESQTSLVMGGEGNSGFAGGLGFAGRSRNMLRGLINQFQAILDIKRGVPTKQTPDKLAVSMFEWAYRDACDQFKETLEESSRYAATPPRPPKDLPQDLHKLHNSICAAIAASKIRACRLRKAGRRWLQLFEESTQKRRGLLRTRSSGNLGMLGPATHNPATTTSILPLNGHQLAPSNPDDVRGAIFFKLQTIMGAQQNRHNKGRGAWPLRCVNTEWLGGVDWRLIEAKATGEVTQDEPHVAPAPTEEELFDLFEALLEDEPQEDDEEARTERAKSRRASEAGVALGEGIPFDAEDRYPELQCGILQECGLIDLSCEEVMQKLSEAARTPILLAPLDSADTSERVDAWLNEAAAMQGGTRQVIKPSSITQECALQAVKDVRIYKRSMSAKLPRELGNAIEHGFQSMHSSTNHNKGIKNLHPEDYNKFQMKWPTLLLALRHSLDDSVQGSKLWANVLKDACAMKYLAMNLAQGDKQQSQVLQATNPMSELEMDMMMQYIQRCLDAQRGQAVRVSAVQARPVDASRVTQQLNYSKLRDNEVYKWFNRYLCHQTSSALPEKASDLFAMYTSERFTGDSPLPIWPLSSTTADSAAASAKLRRPATTARLAARRQSDGAVMLARPQKPLTAAPRTAARRQSDDALALASPLRPSASVPVPGEGCQSMDASLLVTSARPQRPSTADPGPAARRQSDDALALASPLRPSASVPVPGEGCQSMDASLLVTSARSQRPFTADPRPAGRRQSLDASVFAAPARSRRPSTTSTASMSTAGFRESEDGDFISITAAAFLPAPRGGKERRPSLTSMLGSLDTLVDQQLIVRSEMYKRKSSSSSTFSSRPTSTVSSAERYKSSPQVGKRVSFASYVASAKSRSPALCIPDDPNDDNIPSALRVLSPHSPTSLQPRPPSALSSRGSATGRPRRSSGPLHSSMHSSMHSSFGSTGSTDSAQTEWSARRQRAKSAGPGSPLFDILASNSQTASPQPPSSPQPRPPSSARPTSASARRFSVPHSLQASEQPPSDISLLSASLQQSLPANSPLLSSVCTPQHGLSDPPRASKRRSSKDLGVMGSSLVGQQRQLNKRG